MTQNECVKEVLKSFEFYNGLFIALKRETWFYYSLLGWEWRRIWKSDLYFKEVTFKNFSDWKRIFQRMEAEGYPIGDVSIIDGQTAYGRMVQAVQRKKAEEYFCRYLVKSVRLGRQAGLDNLTICYLLCRKLHDAGCGAPGSFAAFSMKDYADKVGKYGVAKAMEEFKNQKMDNPAKISLKAKLSFIRGERLLRRNAS